MLKKNKIKVIISSIIILLPALFGIIMWNDLPDIITTHWGADGNADGLSGKVFAVFGTPIILLIFHFVCLLFTSLDKKQKDQNQKALGMVFWILPIISLFANGIMYRAAFGKEFDLAFFMPAMLGVMFLCLFFNIGKVGLQFAACQQLDVEHFSMLTDIPQMPLSPYSDMPFFFFGR